MQRKEHKYLSCKRLHAKERKIKRKIQSRQVVNSLHYITKHRVALVTKSYTCVVHKNFYQTAPRFMTQELDRNQCMHGRPQKFFQERATSNIAYPFQVADDAMQMHVDKVLYQACPWESHGQRRS